MRPSNHDAWTPELGSPSAILDGSTRQVAVPLQIGRTRPPDAHTHVRRMDGLAMGTTWSVSFAEPRSFDAHSIRADIESCLDRVVAQMSPFLETSDLCRFNRSSGEWCELPEPFASVLGCAMDVAYLSGGAYDPTVGPLVDLWGFGPAGSRDHAPAKAALSKTRRRVGYSKIELDPLRAMARQPGGVSVDLCGIAKGYAVDAVCHQLAAQGLEHYLVEIGGELRGHGVKPDGQPWWVAVEPPAHDADMMPPQVNLVVALHGLSVATSGVEVRRFQSGGTWYSHTIDPRVGRPVSHSLASVTVLHQECMQADAWATALMVLGPEAGMALATALELAVVFVTRAQEATEPRVSPALRALLQ